MPMSLGEKFGKIKADSNEYQKLSGDIFRNLNLVAQYVAVSTMVWL